ncbi:hypothetical protein GCK72_022910 [Caenorhabditis remanei]|uniref:WD repeat domain phosphoinositide-interacting protein 2 n=2 Tax=Caenorhabditis remanei TaxID=31234 RepID=A0A6A5FV94_CAERE|nr:hypothetical protein GCK72_022910 [Caenorhabditis remanei]KAF1746454.1 hypothetical protein GCK72_022910 [Caenorhabditis remanei]
MIAVGHKEGYMFYKTSDVLEKSRLSCGIQNLNNLGLQNCTIIERLFSSSLMIVVSQKNLRVLNVATNNIICDHQFNKPVITVRLNKQRVIVCLEDSIHIYNINDMKMMHSIVDTPLNKLGVVDLTSNSGDAYIAFPGNTKTGSVHLFDAINLVSVNTFVAHEGALACLQFNQKGDMIATASTKGTVIRVYSVPDGHLLFEFRRGVSRCVTIYSLCFSSDSKYLASSSNTETVHVFKLEKTEDVSKPEVPNDMMETAAGWLSAFNKTVSAYLPYQFMQVSELMTTERSFATAKLPCVTESNRVALVSHKSHQYLMVATNDGYVYAYQMNPEGGELDLVKQHHIGPESESLHSSPLGNVTNTRSHNDF